MKQELLLEVFSRTGGHCHFCGDVLEFENYGKKRWPYPKGAWELDHVIQRAKGGKDEPANCLPACRECNHLRWHRRGDNLRKLLRYGLAVADEEKKDSPLWRALEPKLAAREARNRKRRK